MTKDRVLLRRLEAYCTTDLPPGVVAVYLFGSRAEGRAHRESDIDLGVLVDYRAHPAAKNRFDLRVRMTSDLIAALHDNDVDLVVVNDAPPVFARRIVLDGRLICCKDPDLERAFRRDVQLRAADLAPFLERMRRLKLASLAR